MGTVSAIAVVLQVRRRPAAAIGGGQVRPRPPGDRYPKGLEGGGRGDPHENPWEAGLDFRVLLVPCPSRGMWRHLRTPLLPAGDRSVRDAPPHQVDPDATVPRVWQQASPGRTYHSTRRRSGGRKLGAGG